MNDHYSFDDLPEEEANAELIQQLRTAYSPKSEEQQALSRIRRRLSEKSSAAPQFHDQLSLQQQLPLQLAQKHTDEIAVLSPPRRPGLRLLNVIAALLVVTILTGTFVFVLSLSKNSAPAQNPPAPPPTKPHNGVMLTSGLRLAVMSEQVIWAISGKAPLDKNNSGTWDSILRSTDGGKHWQTINSPVSYNDSGLLYVLDETTAWMPSATKPRALYRTLDGGKSWQKFAWPDPDAGTGTMTFIDSQHGWNFSRKVVPISLNNPTPATPTPQPTNLFYTDNGGKSWQKIAQLSPSIHIDELRFITQQRGWATASSPNALSSDLYITNDGGKTWQKQALPLPPGISEGARAYQTLTNMVFSNLSDGAMLISWPDQAYLYTTHDGGLTWLPTGSALKDIPVLQVIDGQHLLGSSIKPQSPICQFTLTNDKWIKAARCFAQNSVYETPGVRFANPQVGIALLSSSQHTFDVYQTTDSGTIWHKISSLPQPH